MLETYDVYGFNSATGLPRAVATALKRGSVITFRSAHGQSEPICKLRGALQRLRQQELALGERVADGFGCFVLDLDMHRPDYWKATAETPTEPDAGQQPAARWRETVLQQVIEFTQKPRVDPRGKNGPSVTQWQWLRHQAEVASDEKGLQQLLGDLKEHAGRLAGAQWEGHIDEIEQQLAKLSAFTHKQLFLTALAQLEVARARQDRKHS